MVKTLIFSFLFSLSLSLYSQVDSLDTNEKGKEDYIFYLNSVTLGDDNFKWSEEDIKRYYFLQRKVRKVYDYACQASYRYQFINARMKELKTEKEKKELRKITENYIEENYTERLKKLSRTDGQVLCKLIYYKTGVTVYDIVKDMKSSWSAFWWDKKGNLFDIEIEEPFNPRANKDDLFIWMILKNDTERGILRDPYPKFN